jgi:hypothetical protein
MREYEKIQATLKLMSELAKGEKSGRFYRAFDNHYLPVETPELNNPSY